ncbi:MAG: hypothetical protein IT285_05925 [Bdellovibrionales bacterium]|nr:hypothetical protein [Bdellovibrionales bacterium]
MRLTVDAGWTRCSVELEGESYEVSTEDELPSAGYSGVGTTNNGGNNVQFLVDSWRIELR